MAEMLKFRDLSDNILLASETNPFPTTGSGGVGSTNSQTQGWDGATWQDITATAVGSDWGLMMVLGGSVAYDDTNSVFKNALYGPNAGSTAYNPTQVIQLNGNEAFTGNERGIVVLAHDGTDWYGLRVNSTTGALIVDTEAPAGSVLNGQTTVATPGTAVQLIAASTPSNKVTIKAESTNTGNIFVGDSLVSSANGLILLPGESVDLNIDNLNKVYIDAAIGTDGVSYLGS